MKKIEAIIFDLGGVLIDWNPEYVYLEFFDNDRKKMQWFFDNICTSDWNENQDAGYSMAKATEERVVLFPKYEKEIRMFYGQWEDMLGEAIEGTVAILKKFKESEQHKIVALTNWSHETFPIALKKFKFLQWFEGIIVSGEENTRKPFDAIYNLTINRFNLNAETSLFIDDNLRNIEAAEKLGIRGIHFSNPEQLINQLKTYNIHL
ncbi:HAD family hydrolase [Changchengzhania lutea]|uniref:HAD family hydrolase n=1 Tax=Changchengzhania lutea TaxID=2049305 RepID=UPI00115C7B4D|nr:HAD family phosphatase [Changchengzhania lutea]